MSPTRTIAVVGAGLAGLRAAECLLAAGAHVTLLEKSRGPGGRCATRHSSVGPFDHGAAAFAATQPTFRSALAAARAEGLLREADPAARLLPAPGAQAAVFAGQPFMNAWPQVLAARLGQAGLQLLREATVRELQPQPGGGWRLALAEAAASEALGGRIFDTVLLAVPAEQAVPLLAPHDTVLAAPLAACRSEACITLMSAWPETAPSRGPGLLQPADGPLARLIRQPGADGRARWVAHARADWSLAHIDESPEALQGPMVEALRQALGAQAPAGLPPHAVVHRWRYAQQGRPAAGACGWSAARRLGSCGDAWQGSASEAPRDGVERAWLSGEALAGRVLAD